MEILNVAGSKETPAIILDKAKGVFEISGRSIPDNAAEVYQPVLNWLSAYGKDPNPTTDFALKLEYLNTGSSKSILDIMTALQKIKGAKILWYFQEDDEDMEETGEEFAELVEIPFEFKAY